MSNNNLVVEGKNIYKSFLVGKEPLEVLKGINLSVNQGEFVSIMGPSGCGKSTLLYILGGLDNPTSGNVFINGQEIASLDDERKSEIRRQSLGFIFQFYNLVQNLTVEENILLPIVLDNKKVSEKKEKINEILEFVGLTDRKYHTPRELSGGQQQRVAIARALIIDPQIIFADEPTGNLDSKSSTQVMELFQKISRLGETTIVQVTHSKDASQYGNRIINMLDGTII